MGPPPPLRESLRFGALEIAFDGRLLRPRRWTTAQSAWAAELLPRMPDGAVLELCAGAGHIGLLAIAASPRPLVAVDLNPVACTYIVQNAEAAGLGPWVEVRSGSVEDVLSPDERFSLVIADPPWVPSSEVSRFPDDPLTAIDGGADGLDIARGCIQAIGVHLSPGGACILQLGSVEQVELVADEAAAAGLAPVELRSFERGALLRLDRR